MSDSGSDSASRGALVATACAAVLTTVALLPVSGRQLGASISFMPAMLAIVACFDVLSVYLLVGDYQDRGDPRLLMMAWAYAWSLVVMGGYALAFPGAVMVSSPLASTPSMAPYLYVTWHCGFPVLLGVAWFPWPAHWMTPCPRGRRRIRSAVTVALAVAGGATMVVLLVAFSHRLPVLINGLNTSLMTELTAPVVVPLVILALIIVQRGTRRRMGPERWSPVAILTCLCDLTVTYASRTRYSLGWYFGRSLTLLSAAVVLMAMLAAFRRLKTQAERDATVDALTGLSNRRGLNEALERMVACSRRSGAHLGVISLDLDFFKQVNDRHGHDGGDAVLVELGRLLARSCRVSDVVARLGGEEFLMLLPDTDARGTLVVAEKIRGLVESMIVPTVNQRLTASLGVTVFRDEDSNAAPLLRRADMALYEAKKTGRNRVVVAAAATCAAGVALAPLASNA